MKRTLLITIKVNEREHRLFTMVAKYMDLPVSGMVRALVRDREIAFNPRMRRSEKKEKK